MRYQSQQMIQEIINGQEIEETEKAFRKRQEKGINWTKLTPTFY